MNRPPIKHWKKKKSTLSRWVHSYTNPNEQEKERKQNKSFIDERLKLNKRPHRARAESRFTPFFFTFCFFPLVRCTFAYPLLLPIVQKVNTNLQNCLQSKATYKKIHTHSTRKTYFVVFIKQQYGKVFSTLSKYIFMHSSRTAYTCQYYVKTKKKTFIQNFNGIVYVDSNHG